MIDTADGRVLLVQEGGEPAGRAVVAHLGSPGSRILYGPHLVDAAERGIRLIGYDRPGYGGSTARPGRSVADCVPDVRAIVDALDVERFAVWGISAGGPHALACASLLPDRVVAAATLACPAPFDAPNLDWFAGVGRENVEDGELMLRDPAAGRTKLESDRLEVLEATARELPALYPTLYSPTDAAALTGDLADYYVRRDRDGLAPGIEGWWDDSVALLRPWGFSPETIRAPVMVWQGRRDWIVPFAHGEWLASHLPAAEPHLTDEDGHLTLFEHRVPAVHAWLAEHF